MKTAAPFHRRTATRKPKATGCTHLTVEQNRLYWRLWSTVKTNLVKFGGLTTAQADDKRHEIHREALGSDKSHNKFDQADFDRIISAFSAYDLHADPRRAKAAVEQPRIRSLFAIRGLITKLMLTESEVSTIVQSHFKALAPDWNQWPESDLIKLKLHLTSKVRAAGKRGASE